MEKINDLIAECLEGFKEIEEKFSGQKKIQTNEKEEKFYITKFIDAGINSEKVKPLILQIYRLRNQLDYKEGLNKIKEYAEANKTGATN